MASPVFAARLKRLENRNRPPVRVRRAVAYFSPDGRLLGALPKSRRIMVATDFGTDAEWEAAAIAQQSKLLSEGSKQ